MLLDRAALMLGVDRLRPEDFYRGEHHVIFEVLRRMVRDGRDVDFVTVTAALQEAGLIEKAGGASYVAGLPNTTPAPVMMQGYVDSLGRFAAKRTALAVGQLLQKSALNGADASSYLAEARALLDECTRPREPQTGEIPPGDVLLRNVGSFLSRFVVFGSPHQVVAVSLWVLHTHVLDAAEATPYLAITSAEKQSGKSRLLEVLEPLVPRPWLTIRPSEAILFRAIAARNPVLLLDEVDAIFKDKVGTYEGHRALLNSGHRRGTMVSRCVGDGKNIRLEEFPVFCAKALAGIGELPDTVADRSIPIRLLPRRRGVEHVERFRARDVKRDAEPTRVGLMRWAGEALGRLRGARPEIPSSISDRAQDGWEPLLAIADLAGGEWPRRAREAAVALHGNPMAQEDTVGVALLRAIRETFETRGVDRITTADLVECLVERDDGPWAEWWGKAVSAGDPRGPGSRVARLLRPYGITSRTIRLDDVGTVKGYVQTDFEDAFSRFLLSPSGERRNNVTSLDNQGPEGRNEDVTDPPMLRSENPLGAASSTECDVVTSPSALGEGEREKEIHLEPSAPPSEDPLVAYARQVFCGDVVETRPAPGGEESQP